MLKAIESLPEAEREVFDLVGLQGLTYAEAATLIDASQKTVQRRLNRVGSFWRSSGACPSGVTDREPPPRGDTPNP